MQTTYMNVCDCVSRYNNKKVYEELSPSPTKTLFVAGGNERGREKAQEKATLHCSLSIKTRNALYYVPLALEGIYVEIFDKRGEGGKEIKTSCVLTQLKKARNLSFHFLCNMYTGLVGFSLSPLLLPVGRFPLEYCTIVVSCFVPLTFHHFILCIQSCLVSYHLERKLSGFSLETLRPPRFSSYIFLYRSSRIGVLSPSWQTYPLLWIFESKVGFKFIK